MLGCGEDMTLAQAAKLYCDFSWSVFQVAPMGKRPLPGSRGFKDASLRQSVAYERWLALPDANVGVACGASGLVVIDLDSYADGFAESMAMLEANGYSFPPTLSARTARGGVHHYYYGRMAGGAATLGRGIDVRGEGQYVVAPPSEWADPVTGEVTSYEWTDDVPTARLPAWVPAYAAALRTPAAPSLPVVGSHNSGAYGAAALRNACAAVASAPEGTRNDELNKQAFGLGQLVAAGEIDGEAVKAGLERAGISAGLRAAACRGTVASGLRAGSKHPRSAPAPTGAR